MSQTCTGDCLKCPFQQQMYCAAQRSYGLMKNQETIVAMLNSIDARIADFTSGQKITPIDDNAQISSGAENREL